MRVTGGPPPRGRAGARRASRGLPGLTPSPRCSRVPMSSCWRCRTTDETRALIGAAELARMKSVGDPRQRRARQARRRGRAGRRARARRIGGGRSRRLPRGAAAGRASALDSAERADHAAQRVVRRRLLDARRRSLSRERRALPARRSAHQRGGQDAWVLTACGRWPTCRSSRPAGSASRAHRARGRRRHRVDERPRARRAGPRPQPRARDARDAPRRSRRAALREPAGVAVRGLRDPHRRRRDDAALSDARGRARSASILRDSGASMAIVSTPRSCSDRVLSVAGEAPDLRTIVVIDAAGDAAAEPASDRHPRGRRRARPPPHPRRLGRRQGVSGRRQAGPAVTISRRSSTRQARPASRRASMLTHGNLVANLDGARRGPAISTDEDVALSFLPLCHAFERIVAYVYLAQRRVDGLCRVDRHDRARPALVRPTVMTGVPRVFEKLQARMLAAGPRAAGASSARSSMGAARGAAPRGGAVGRRRAVGVAAARSPRWPIASSSARFASGSAAACASPSPAARRCRSTSAGSSTASACRFSRATA